MNFLEESPQKEKLSELIIEAIKGELDHLCKKGDAPWKRRNRWYDKNGIKN